MESQFISSKGDNSQFSSFEAEDEAKSTKSEYSDDSSRIEEKVFNCIKTEDYKGLTAKLAKNLDLDAMSSFRTSPLNEAIMTRNKQIVSILLEFKADPNKSDSTGEYPIHQAISVKNQEILDLLLKFGADPNVPNDAGRTPMHEAVRLNLHPSVLFNLYDKGGSFDSLDINNKKPEDFATSAEIRRLAELLKRGEKSKIKEEFKICVGLSNSQSVRAFLQNRHSSRSINNRYSEYEDNASFSEEDIIEDFNEIQLSTRKTHQNRHREEYFINSFENQFVAHRYTRTEPGNPSQAMKTQMQAKNTKFASNLLFQQYNLENTYNSSQSHLDCAEMSEFCNKLLLFEYPPILIRKGILRIPDYLDQFEKKYRFKALKDAGISKNGHILRILIKLEIDKDTDKTAKFDKINNFFSDSRNAVTSSLEQGSAASCFDCKTTKIKITSFDQWLFSKNLQSLGNKLSANGFNDLPALFWCFLGEEYCFNYIMTDFMQIKSQKVKLRFKKELEKDFEIILSGKVNYLFAEKKPNICSIF